MLLLLGASAASCALVCECVGGRCVLEPRVALMTIYVDDEAAPSRTHTGQRKGRWAPFGSGDALVVRDSASWQGESALARKAAK